MRYTPQLIAAAALGVIGLSAFAQEATPDTWINEARSSKTHEHVMAELQAARKDGTIKAGSADCDFVGRARSTKTREEVRNELADARVSGEYQALNSEAHEFENGTAKPSVHANVGSRNLP